MTTRIHIRRPDELESVNARLADLIGWFEAAPLPETLTSLMDQLEAAYEQAGAEEMAARL